VTHRPRSHGKSHYNLWNRSLRVVVDLLGVAWLCRRAIRYDVAGPGGPIPRPHFTMKEVFAAQRDAMEVA
jgi:hypothetical protein